MRPNIRKATLRGWRRDFARHLREQGVAANATPRAVRGETRTQKPDGIHRAQLRGDSRHMRERVMSAAVALTRGERIAEPGKGKLMETRRQVRHAWLEISEATIASGQTAVVGQIQQFVAQMAPPRTEHEQMLERSCAVIGEGSIAGDADIEITTDIFRSNAVDRQCTSAIGPIRHSGADHAIGAYAAEMDCPAFSCPTEAPSKRFW